MFICGIFIIGICETPGNPCMDGIPGIFIGKFIKFIGIPVLFVGIIPCGVVSVATWSDFPVLLLIVGTLGIFGMLTGVDVDVEDTEVEASTGLGGMLILYCSCLCCCSVIGCAVANKCLLKLCTQ